MIQTLKCTADLIEDLLQEGVDYVLISRLQSRLQSDPLERRFSKYRQIIGGRFPVALREVLCSEKILQMKSLLEENLNLWELDVRPEDDVLIITENVEFQNDFEEIDLDDNSKEEVATYIAGYITKKLLKKSCCELCRKILSDDQISVGIEYTNLLSGGGLRLPTNSLATYACRSCAKLDLAKHGDLSHDLRKDNNFKLKLPLYGFDTGSVLVIAVL